MLLPKIGLCFERLDIIVCFSCDYDQAFSSYLPARLFGSDAPFVIRHQPHLLIQSPKPVPAIASKAEVENTM
jgi:hypothetical protein